MVNKSHEITLVPRRPVIGRQLDLEVMVAVQGGAVTWQSGLQREMGCMRGLLLHSADCRSANSCDIWSTIA